MAFALSAGWLFLVPPQTSLGFLRPAAWIARAGIRHAFDELLEEMEVVPTILERMRVIRDVHQALADADRLRGDPEKVRARRVPVARRRGQADLVGIELVPRIGPNLWFLIGVQNSPPQQYPPGRSRTRRHGVGD